MTEYEHKVKEELLAQCAPADQNNERKYWAKRIDTWYRTKNPSVGEDIAERFGLATDFKSGYDYGNQPSYQISN